MIKTFFAIKFTIMQKKTIVVIGLFLVSICGFSQEIRQSLLTNTKIKSGMENYLEKIPYGHEEYFGFSNRDEFESVDFGHPLQRYSLNADSIIYDAKAIKPSGLWYIPLIVDSSYRCFLQVRVFNNSYKVVGIGMKEIAIDVDRFASFNQLKQSNCKALFLDEITNILCLVTENDSYYPIRAISSCKTCENKKTDSITKHEFLASVRIFF